MAAIENISIADVRNYLIAISFSSPSISPLMNQSNFPSLSQPQQQARIFRNIRNIRFDLLSREKPEREYSTYAEVLKSRSILYSQRKRNLTSEEGIVPLISSEFISTRLNKAQYDYDRSIDST